VTREEQIEAFVPLVRTIARRLNRVLHSAELDDLIGDGCIGLIRAVDRFDPERGPLETYARRLILGAMLNGVRRRDPVSERVRRAVRRAESRRLELAQTRMAMPASTELERDEPALRAARVAAHVQTPLSLEVPLPGGRDALADVSLDPARLTVERARRRVLGKAVALLPERQRHILALHYGDREVSLRAIGAHLQLSPQRISQLHLSALERLRRSLPAPP
jgi:RNA polymerase sigma factor for flagellar operon FliA